MSGISIPSLLLPSLPGIPAPAAETKEDKETEAADKPLFTVSFDIPFVKLTLGKELEENHFGAVFQGKYRGGGI